ncbi:type 4a pilus secretin PilQ [Aurantivibrio infirmus]
MLIVQKRNCLIPLAKLLILGAGFFWASLLAANTLESINFSALPGDRFEVRLDFSEAPPEPEGYTIEDPARIVMDFPGVENGLAERRFPLSIANAKTAMVLPGDNRTRLILNLAELSGYSSRAEGNTYIIEVGGGNQVASSQASTSTTSSVSSTASSSRATASRGQGNRITNIDFRRGDQGEGRVIVTLSNPNVNIDLQKSGSSIQLSFDDVSVPADLMNRYDVVDFATPVKFVDADTQRGGAVIRVEASGDYDYLAYQTDTEYVVSVKPLTKKEVEARKDKFDYIGERISLNFQDVPVKSVLQLLAEFNDLNLVTGENVSGNIALRLDNVPWDQALDVVLKSKGLDKRQIGNVLLVAPADEIAERERQEIETLKQLEELAPLRTEYIRVRFANARELFDLFNTREDEQDDEGNTTGSILSSRGTAIVDERTNSIILTDTEDKIAQFRALVDQIDIPIQQVQIEARIVIANTTFRDDIGVRWGGSAIDTPGSDVVSINGATSPFNNTVVDLAAGLPAGAIEASILTDNILLDLELSALENNGEGEIVSQPKIITGDKQQATISKGQRIPYQTVDEDGDVITRFEEILLKLDATPQITPDDNIIMDLVITQDNVNRFIAGANGGLIPVIDTTGVTTQVLVADGQTVVLGGIYETTENDSVTKVPFFGDVPYFGRLFRRTSSNTDKRELLIFITPRIQAETLVQ